MVDIKKVNPSLNLYDAYCDDDCGKIVEDRVLAKSRNQAIKIIKEIWIEKYKCININSNGYYAGASLVKYKQD